MLFNLYGFTKIYFLFVDSLIKKCYYDNNLIHLKAMTEQSNINALLQRVGGAVNPIYVLI